MRKAEQDKVRDILDDVRQTMVRVQEFSVKHPRASRDADFGDIAADAVMSYYGLLVLLDDAALAKGIVENDRPLLAALESDGLWPEESLLRAASK